MPQNVGVRFTDEGGKRHEIYARLALPPKFGGTIILVLKHGDNGKDYEMGMYVDKFNRKELWKRFSWNDQSIKRTLQSPQERSRFNFGLLTDAGSPLTITWFKNNYYHVYEDEAQTLVATPAVLSKGGMVWAKEVTVLPTPREVDIAFRLPDGKGEFLLDSLLQSDRGPDPLPENFKGDIVALVHEGAGGFELRIFLAPFDSLATLPDAETLLKVLEAKYASSHDRRDVTENRAPSPNGVPVYREMYGKCELIVCDGVLPPP